MEVGAVGIMRSVLGVFVGRQETVGHSLELISHTPAACSFPGEKARSWEALGEARPGQSSLSAGALRYRAWAQSWSSAALCSIACGILLDQGLNLCPLHWQADS